MANNKQITELTNLGAVPAAGDFFAVVDVSDTSGGAAGTTKKVTYSQIPSGSAGQPASVSTFTYAFSALNNANTSEHAQGDIVSGSRYWAEIMIPFNVTLTGIGYKVGSSGTAKIIGELHDTNGVFLVGSSTSGIMTVGSEFDMQKLPFTAPYALTAGRYFIAIQYNSDVNGYYSDGHVNSGYVSGSATGTFGVSANITPGTAYTVNIAPVSFVY